MASNYSNRLQHVFSWKIINFSMCSKAVGEPLQSPSFKAENIERDAIWYINFYPQGIGQQPPNYASLHLVRSDENPRVCGIQCEFSMEIIDSDENAVYSGIQDFLFSPGTFTGFSGFVCMNELSNNPKCLPDDTLTFRCRMKGKYATESKTSRNVGETKIGFDRLSFKWELQNPCHLPTPAKYCFRLGAAGKYEMVFSPWGHGIKLFINQVARKDPLTKVIVKMSFLDRNGSESEQRRYEHVYSESIKLCYIKNFLTQKELRSKYMKYVWNDALHINCQFTASNGTEAMSTVEYQYCPPLYDNVPDDVDPLAALIGDLQNMYSTQKFTDVKLRSKDQLSVDAHKAILSARSEKFSKMFENCQLSEVDFPSVPHEVLKKFVEYLYTDVIIELDLHCSYELVYLATIYEVKSLNEYCSEFIKQRIEAGDVSHFLNPSFKLPISAKR